MVVPFTISAVIIKLYCGFLQELPIRMETHLLYLTANNFSVADLTVFAHFRLIPLVRELIFRIRLRWDFYNLAVILNWKRMQNIALEFIGLLKVLYLLMPEMFGYKNQILPILELRLHFPVL